MGLESEQPFRCLLVGDFGQRRATCVQHLLGAFLCCGNYTTVGTFAGSINETRRQPRELEAR